MNLIFYFDGNGGGNPYFKQIYTSIYDRFKILYPEHSSTHLQPDYEKLEYCPACPGNVSSLLIINQSNQKTILMSFMDRGMDIFTNGLGWNKYKIEQFIGGLGINISPEIMFDRYGIKRIPYQYPLGVPNSYPDIEEVVFPYIPENKIKKAVFIGMLYGTREIICKKLKKHPLFEIFDSDQGYVKKEYYKKMSEYIMSLSFNGNGELCLRDFEIMGINVPLVRSELITQLYNPIFPGTHYLRGSDPCDSAWYVYLNKNINDIIDQFVSTVEANITEYEKLKNISENGNKYFNQYCYPEYIIDLFFKLIDINKIK